MPTNPDPRHYRMDGSTLIELSPATCPAGHDRRGGGVGFMPCRCTDGYRGHRTWDCPKCGVVAVWPACKERVGWREWKGVVV